MTAWRFLFISLAIHLVVWLILLNRPNFKFPENDKSVEVTIVDENANKKPKRIVRQAVIPLDLLNPEPPKQADVLSEKTQSVKKQTKAPNHGLTQNGNSNKNSPNPMAQKPQNEPSVNKEKNLDQFAPGPSNRQYTPSNNVMSTTGEYLPDIADGPITALNSERFVYYSFFSRIEERLRPLWERNVESSVQRLPPSTQKQLVDHNWITSLEVLLDSEGHYVETVIHHSSGVPEIDQAAINAFAEAKFFPNPPKEMVKSDHRIHLNYAFVVQWGASGWNKRGM